MIKLRFLAIFLVALIFNACNKPVNCIESDTLIYNTKVYTANDNNPEVQAVAVKNKNIIFVGSNEEAKAYKCGGAFLLDLQDSFVYPGFIDSHVHVKGIGYRELNLNLQGIDSLKEMLTVVEIYSNSKNPGDWIVGRGWIEKNWPEARFPTIEELDRFSKDRPVVLERADGHAVIANSYALALAGINSKTMDPHGGAINKDSKGNPTGLLVDKASLLVERLIPKKTLKQDKEALEIAINKSIKLGWTQLHDAGSPYSDFEILEEVKSEGNLNTRIQFYASDGPDALRMLEEGIRIDPEHLLSARGIKLYADGAIGSRGAAFLDKYHDYDTSGFLIFEKEKTMPVLIEALKKGIQIETHAIGDKGNQVTLDWYEEAFSLVSKDKRLIADPRWRIEHAQNIQPEDQLRYKKMDIIASMQPSHAIGDLHFAEKRLGLERLKNAYVWRSLLNQGVRVVGGSDAPVEIGDPRIEFKAAIGRKDLNGFHGEGWHLEEAVERQDALKMFTKWASYSVFEEDIKGTIEVGKLADFTILSKDIMTIDEEEIMSSEVVMTIVGGKIVYSR
jgi:predicted amidohydrolase YtcJ